MTHFRERIEQLTALCEAQMLAEGWQQPDFDENDFRHLASYATCLELDTLIASSYKVRGRQEMVTAFHLRGQLSVADLGHIKVYQDEALLLDVLPDAAVRFTLDRRLPTTLGYIGVRPILDEKSDSGELPYAGPFMVGSIKAGFSFRQNGTDTTWQCTNQFGFMRLRDMQFPSLLLELPTQQQSLS